MEEDSWWEEHCSVIPPESLRLILVGCAGSILATVSVIFNTFLFITLVFNRTHHRSQFLYLIFLALFDTFLSASYILLFPVNLFMDFFESETLAAAWWAYMRPMLALCHVTISTSALLIVAAAFERYLTISRIQISFHRNSRIAISLIALLFALLCKAPMFFELEVVANENCTGVTERKAIVAEWTEHEPYKTVYRFWFRNVITIFLPFILLFYFNIRIVARLRRQHQGARLFRFATSEHRKNIRSATRMLVLVSCTYLASNVLNVIISAWEFIDLQSLLTPQLRPLYTYSSDLVSLLTVLSCACRLPIYCTCNQKMRTEVWCGLRFLLSAYKKVPWDSKREKCFQQTFRYCNSGNGLLMHEVSSGSKTKDREARRTVCVGTGIDKVALSVALGQVATQGGRFISARINGPDD
uniref:G-protein coupled receptors family 1 profile domain-containing protein n=2 Tax=Parascaris TaxID=6254 RepID=A0A915BWP5_PARUN